MHQLHNLYAPVVLWLLSVLALAIGALWLAISDWHRKRRQ